MVGVYGRHHGMILAVEVVVVIPQRGMIVFHVRTKDVQNTQVHSFEVDNVELSKSNI
jgi:hypothetical protein